MTKRKSPNVMMVSGSVNKMISGLRTKLRTANTSAKIIAVVILMIFTWGANNFDKANTTTAVISIFIINLMLLIFKCYLADSYHKSEY